MEGVRKGLLIVVSGPAGSGKGTLMKIIMRKSSDFVLSVSATSRPILKREREGENYFFITREQFEERISSGEMLEYTEYCGNYYGTPKKWAMDAMESGKHVLLEIEVNGGAQIKKLYPDAVLVMVVPPNAALQEQRLRRRGRDSEESIQKRLTRAKEEIEIMKSYDYVVINEDGKAEKAAKDIMDIARAEQCAVSRNLDLADKF